MYFFLLICYSVSFVVLLSMSKKVDYLPTVNCSVWRALSKAAALCTSLACYSSRDTFVELKPLTSLRCCKSSLKFWFLLLFAVAIVLISLANPLPYFSVSFADIDPGSNCLLLFFDELSKLWENLLAIPS